MRGEEGREEGKREEGREEDKREEEEEDKGSRMRYTQGDITVRKYQEATKWHQGASNH